MYYREKGSVREYFTKAISISRTSGISKGYIIRYRDFYLKVYDAPRDPTSYLITGYRYHHPDPLFQDVVRFSELRAYASELERPLSPIQRNP